MSESNIFDLILSFSRLTADASSQITIDASDPGNWSLEGGNGVQIQPYGSTPAPPMHLLQITPEVIRVNPSETDGQTPQMQMLIGVTTTATTLKGNALLAAGTEISYSVVGTGHSGKIENGPFSIQFT